MTEFECLSRGFFRRCFFDDNVPDAKPLYGGFESSNADDSIDKFQYFNIVYDNCHIFCPKRFVAVEFNVLG